MLYQLLPHTVQGRLACARSDRYPQTVPHPLSTLLFGFLGMDLDIPPVGHTTLL
jgi:hypothetical protein